MALLSAILMPGLAKSLGHEEWLEDPRFAEISALQKNRTALQPLIAAAMREHTLADLCLRMDEYELPYSPVEKVNDVIHDAHLIENEVLVKTHSDRPDYGWTVAPLTWAQRLKRVFNIDVTVCPLCGGTMRIIADITDPDIIQKILDHIEPQPPPLNPATAIQS